MKIVVLAGGTSTEREVSLVSGMGVYTALKNRGHKVVLLDVYKGVTCSANEIDGLFEKAVNCCSEFKVELGEKKRAVELADASKEAGFFGENVIQICKKADICFLALHGENGEDGKLQAAFDLLNIKYTGTDYISSAIAMDKHLTKVLLQHAGINTPKGIKMNIGIGCEEFPCPCVIKTIKGGSSLGVYFANNVQEYMDSIQEAKAFGSEVVVEQFIDGKEYTVAVINGEALPIVQIEPKEGVYDYSNKYIKGRTSEICPAPISQQLTERIQKEAVRAYEALGLKVYARIDFIVTEKEEIYCLEANTLPGMTPTSLIPQEAAAIGMNYEQLCEEIIRLSELKYN